MAARTLWWVRASVCETVCALVCVFVCAFACVFCAFVRWYPHLLVLLDLALLKHGEHVGGTAVSAPCPPLSLLGCLERRSEHIHHQKGFNVRTPGGPLPRGASHTLPLGPWHHCGARVWMRRVWCSPRSDTDDVTRELISFYSASLKMNSGKHVG